MSATAQPIDIELAEDIGRFYADPLGFVMYAFAWGSGELAGYDGPDEWQRDVLNDIGNEVRDRKFNGRDPVIPILIAIASGHGIGKGVLTSWIILWIMSTRPNCRGTVTANTADQLKTKTWATLAKWKELCICGHWFEYSNSKGNMNLKRINKPDTWRCDAQTCKEENSEAFAGQHAADSTSFYLFDEASNVPSKIFEVAEGGLTDGEPMFFLFGNPTRNFGRFFDCFHRFRHRWIHRQIDSRTCKFPNKEQIKTWADDWGEDSDFFRTRVRGMFPRAGDDQLIPSDVVYQASKIEARYIDDDPMIVGIDVARGGADRNVIVFRKGFDAKTFQTLIIPGEKTRDSMRLVSIIIDRLSPQNLRPELVPDAIFVDETGIGGPILDRLSQLGMNAIGVHFGGKAMDETRYANRASEMWYKMRQWLMKGGAIKAHPDLEMELTNRQFSHDSKDRLIIESKDKMRERTMLPSPDWADALALTFALPVAKLQRDPRTGNIINDTGKAVTEYDRLDPEQW